MNRIFLTLSVVCTVLLVVALLFGLQIQDASLLVNRPAVANHMLVALGALIFALFVHAILFTYFMGTGRWMEETSRAYKLSPEFCHENQRLKYSVLPLMVISFVLLIGTGALGAAADPRNSIDFTGWLGISGRQLHFFTACMTLVVNLMVFIREYQIVSRNGLLIQRAMEEVRRIREQHGLPV